MSTDTTILSIHQLCDHLKLSEASVRRYAYSEADFPRKVQLGPRRIGYLKADVDRYIAGRLAAAESATSR